MFLSLKLSGQILLKISHHGDFLKEKGVSDSYRQKKTYLYIFLPQQS